jgi:hypothetical protein
VNGEAMKRENGDSWLGGCSDAAVPLRSEHSSGCLLMFKDLTFKGLTFKGLTLFIE